MGKMYDALQKVEREKNRVSEEVSPKAAPEDLVLDNRLVSFFEPASMAAEQYRRLRTYVIRPGMENSPKTILVTSAMAGEGKSMTAINLAIIIAIELNSNALIVDCDLRNPSLSRWFGFQEKKGLSDYLLGDAELPDLLVKTSVDKLSILPGGTLQDNPVELIGSKKMSALIADLKARYDDRYIILDSSPLLATTEPSVLNEMVDGILFVIKSGDTPRESIQQALKLLDKKKIIGVVLNNLEFKTNAMIRRYFGTHRYYNDYRYAKSHPEPTGWGKWVSRFRKRRLDK
ncbi:MAG: polysaccharide biosynthesis tyrosine autokinase [Syntrophales bacterium]|nr:polysaccharide biosynthesis tyrosine autokinase [Syntrophales bacterium]